MKVILHKNKNNKQDFQIVRETLSLFVLGSIILSWRLIDGVLAQNSNQNLQESVIFKSFQE